MSINYDKIVTEDLKTLITEERLAELKKEAAGVRNKITKNGTIINNIEYLANRAREYPNTNKNKMHKDLTMAEKAILTANIVFEDRLFSRYLQKFLTVNNYNQTVFKTYLELLGYIKKANDRGLIENINSKYINITNGFTNKLATFFGKFTGINDANIVVNKLNEIISFTPELLYQENNTPRHTR